MGSRARWTLSMQVLLIGPKDVPRVLEGCGSIAPRGLPVLAHFLRDVTLVHALAQRSTHAVAAHERVPGKALTDIAPMGKPGSRSPDRAHNAR